MRVTIRVLLAWFAFFGLSSGLWQMFAPESFYTEFPGFGRHWVDVDGPYNEHLLRDVAQGNLAFGVVALVALLTGGVWLARATGLAAVVANLPHHAYHQTHLHVLPDATDQVLQSVTLGVVSVTAVGLALLAFRQPVGQRRRRRPASGHRRRLRRERRRQPPVPATRSAGEPAGSGQLVQGDVRQLGPGGDAELGEDVPQVEVDRPGRQVEQGRNVPV
jgi:hypothetical protein